MYHRKLVVVVDPSGMNEPEKSMELFSRFFAAVLKDRYVGISDVASSLDEAVTIIDAETIYIFDPVLLRKKLTSMMPRQVDVKIKGQFWTHSHTWQVGQFSQTCWLAEWFFHEAIERLPFMLIGG